ncbi:hypothetical protein Efla_003039 [Eimeria flavescens]
MRWGTVPQQREGSDSKQGPSGGWRLLPAAAAGASEDFPDLLDCASSNYSSGTVTPAQTPAAAAAAAAAGGGGAAGGAAQTGPAALAARGAAAGKKGASAAKGKLRGNTQSLQDFIAAAAATKKETPGAPIGATAWSQGAPKSLAAAALSPTQQQPQQLQQQQQRGGAPPAKRNGETAARGATGAALPPGGGLRPTSDDFPAISAAASAAVDKEIPKRCAAQLQEWKSLLAECELVLDLPILEYLASMPNPLEVEEFLQESFPAHKQLRLFAENFVMTNHKYATRGQADKAGGYQLGAGDSTQGRGRSRKKKTQGRPVDPTLIGGQQQSFCFPPLRLCWHLILALPASLFSFRLPPPRSSLSAWFCFGLKSSRFAPGAHDAADL